MFARNTGWSLLGALISAPAAFGMSVLLARWLDPAVNGQVQAAWSLLMVSSFAAQLGAVAASIHRIRRARRPAGLVVATALLSVTVTGALWVVLLWWLRERLQTYLLVGLPDRAVAWLLALVLPLLWVQVFGGVARALDRFDLWTGAQALQHVARLVLLGLSTLWFAPSAVVAMVALWVAQVLTAVGLGARVLASSGIRPPIDAEELRASTRFGAKTYLFAMAGQLHERIDLFLLAALQGDAVQVATYAVAVGVVNRIRTLPIAMSAALFPRVAELDEAAGARFTAAVCRHATLWTLVLAGVLGAVAAPLVPWIWGAPYAPSVLPLWVLLPATVAFSVSSILGRYFQAIDRQAVNIGSQAVGVAVNVALNLWWIPRHGAVGAAMASLVSYGLQGGWLALAFVRSSGISMRRTFVIQRSDLAWYLERLRGAR